MLERFYHGGTENTELEEWKNGIMEEWNVGKILPRRHRDH